MAGNSSDSKPLLNRYIHDYMVKQGMTVSAQAFAREANVPQGPVMIDTPEGYLAEWWSLFWDKYTTPQSDNEDDLSLTEMIDQFDWPMTEINSQMPPAPTPSLLDAGGERRGLSLGRSIPMSSTSHGVSIGQAGFHDAGKNKGIDPIPLQRWPLTGTGPFSPGMGCNVSNSLSMIPNQQTPGKPIDSFKEGTSDLSDLRHLLIPRNQISGQCNQMARYNQMTVSQRQTAEQQTGEGVSGGGNAQAAEENIESYLSHGDSETADVVSNSFRTSQPSSSACNKIEHEGFSFEETGCLHSSNNKVLCCNFSSDGKLLVSAGHEKKVSICNMDNRNHFNYGEGHSHIITDVRFKRNSKVFATSSFDKTVQIWDASKPRNSFLKLIGHAGQVISLDFHPKNVDLLCSCDSNDEIRLWDVNQHVCRSISKHGASRQVRFQPQFGNLLAAASGNTISVIDIETDTVQHRLEGHTKDVRSMCWDPSGRYIASVSEESARVWSMPHGGRCVHTLHSSGNKFESCTFHPGYALIVAIGSYKSLELWNSVQKSKTMLVNAHNGIIASLADSPQTDLIASASHDGYVKLWK